MLKSLRQARRELTSFSRACILGWGLTCYSLVENVKASLLLDDFLKRAAAPTPSLGLCGLRESILTSHPSPKVAP